MSLTIYQVDAFASKPFQGNPAAICILPGPVREEWMQNLAGEMNLSETAFLYQEGDGYRLRWFTPGAEVDLCGHATLASAHILYETGQLKSQEEVRFYTKSGLLTAKLEEGWITLNFPATLAKEIVPSSELLTALGVKTQYVGQSPFDYLVEVESEEVVNKLEPDLAVLAKLPIRGVIVTSKASSSDYDFVSRFFAPGVGVNEDPVTGSAHCCLAPFWQEKMGKNNFLAYQASKRGGILKIQVQGDRVYLTGPAVTVLRGEILQEEEEIRLGLA